MRSLFSYILPTAARFTVKPTFSRIEGLHAGIKKSRQNATHKPPASLSKHLDMEERQVGGFAVWDIRPKGLPDAEVKGRMLYLHGGSFVLNIMDEHWNLASFIATKLQIVVSVALYPLGPEHTITEAYEMLQPLYNDMAAAATSKTPFYVMGDSAGGCFALALTQLALQAHKPLASRVILISPLLDSSFSNPELRALAKSDPALDLPGIEESRELTAPDLDPETDVRISPMRGPVEGLPSVLLMSAENDLFHAEAKKWVKMADGKVDVEFVVGEGMVHCWPIIDFYEGKVARERIASWISAPRPKL